MLSIPDIVLLSVVCLKNKNIYLNLRPSLNVNFYD